MKTQPGLTHVVVVNYGVVPNVIYAQSDRDGASRLSDDARRLGYNPRVMTTMEYIDLKERRSQSTSS
jgi:hypothetical protein